jgi:hypothetical protein
MTFDWQTIINLVLFAMLVVAFTFAIWSYIKTNNIKNSNSGSVPTVINDNNTYVNNIASAPNLVTMRLGISDQTYKPKSTDNGSDILVMSTGSGLKAKFDVLNFVRDSKNNIIFGYYFNVINGNIIGGDDIEIWSNFGGVGYSLQYTLAPGQSAYYRQYISDVIDSGTGTTGWYSPDVM